MGDIIGQELPDTYFDRANETREAFITRMEAAGYRIVTPKSNELLVDIDSEEQYETFLANWEVLLRNQSTAFEAKYEEHESRSGYPRRHVIVTLPFDVSPWQRIAWQAALGSDPVRELLSAIRLRRGDVHPTLFVEAPAGTEGKNIIEDFDPIL